jgi:hypothetical protein
VREFSRVTDDVIPRTHPQGLILNLKYSAKVTVGVEHYTTRFRAKQQFFNKPAQEKGLSGPGLCDDCGVLRTELGRHAHQFILALLARRSARAQPKVRLQRTRYTPA